MTSNGLVYGWGNNVWGQLGTNNVDVPTTDEPIRVPGISHVVLVSAPRIDDSGNGGGAHSLALTLAQGTNQYWGWGDNTSGAVGGGSMGGNGTNDGVIVYQSTPVPIQFCTRCQRCVQLGTSGSFTAQCTGTLVLYFNDYQYDPDSQMYGFEDNGTNFFTVTVDGFGQTNVPGSAACGVVVGPVVKGSNCTFSASGTCVYDEFQHEANPDGIDPITSNQVTCSFINITNTICPMRKCFSLVGKIQ